MPSKQESEQLLIVESENSSGFESSLSPHKSTPVPLTQPLSLAIPTTVAPVVVINKKTLAPTQSVKIKDFKNINNSFSDEDFLNGIAFDVKVRVKF